MKKLLLFLAFVLILMLSSCDAEQPDDDEDEKDVIAEKDDYWGQLSNLEAVITKFDGELFGDANITAGYTGFERLNVFGATGIIHCNDNDTIIWRDYNKEAIYRLTRKGEKEKICPLEQCRNALEAECRHMPNSDLVYSDGILYFTLSNYHERNTSVFEYDIDKHEYRKLINFQDVHFCVLALNGRYLYVETYNDEQLITEVRRPDNRVDFSITRIDLFTETAVVVYSDLKNPDNFDKIGELINWRFIDNKIIMPKIDKDQIFNNETKGWITLKTTSMINITTVDMRSFETLLEMESENILFAFGGDVKLYDGEIYFSTLESGLSRVNTETGKREIIHENIESFSIEDNFLYYLIDNTLYRIKLDYTRELNFDEAVAVYTPEANYYLNSWKVYNEYIYAELAGEDNSGYCRIKIRSQEEPYFLYYLN